jgi:hypothetical protein
MPIDQVSDPDWRGRTEASALLGVLIGEVETVIDIILSAI